MICGIGGNRVTGDGCHIRANGPVVILFKVSDGGSRDVDFR
jgi:hypothetical protein